MFDPKNQLDPSTEGIWNDLNLYCWGVCIGPQNRHFLRGQDSWGSKITGYPFVGYVFALFGGRQVVKHVYESITCVRLLSTFDLHTLPGAP